MITRLAVLALVLLAVPAMACERGTLTGHVTYVRDGDTIEFGAMAIRLQGLAAPEWNEPGGTEAREAMLELVHGRTVRCELDGTRTYDRCVGICYLDSQDIGEAMVAAGLVRDCPRFSEADTGPPRCKLLRAARRSERTTVCRDTVACDRSAAAAPDRSSAPVRFMVAGVLEVLRVAIEREQLVQEPVVSRELDHGPAGRISADHVAAFEQVV
jgi:micrococcal nuclease